MGSADEDMPGSNESAEPAPQRRRNRPGRRTPEEQKRWRAVLTKVEDLEQRLADATPHSAEASRFGQQLVEARRDLKEAGTAGKHVRQRSESRREPADGGAVPIATAIHALRE